MKNNLLGGDLSFSFYLHRFRKYVSYGFPIINFCNPGVHYETPCMTKNKQGITQHNTTQHDAKIIPSGSNEMDREYVGKAGADGCALQCCCFLFLLLFCCCYCENFVAYWKVTWALKRRNGK